MKQINLIKLLFSLRLLMSKYYNFQFLKGKLIKICIQISEIIIKIKLL